MAFFEEVGKRIADAGQNVAQQTKNFSDISQLNNAISSNEKQIENLYSVIGRSYYNNHKNDSNSEEAETIDKINTLFTEIAQYTEQIKQIKGIIKCTKCGAEISIHAAFCSFCGASVNAEQNTQFINNCTRCGAALIENCVFCTNCGKKVR